MVLIVVTILLFASLVILHEWGHFMAARRGGVTVEEFGVGFPPKAWGRVVKGTLYSVNWLPLGGFVRLKGEDGADMSKGSFNAAPYWTKAKVLLAGVGMNLLTAIVLLYGLAVTGLPGLGSLEPGFLKPAYAQPKQLAVVHVTPGSPAEFAGVKSGDLIVVANGEAMQTDEALRNFTKSHAGETVKLKIQHGGGAAREINVKLRPADSKEGFLGVATQQVYKLRYDPFNALVAAVWITGALFVATLVGVLNLFLSVPALLLGLFSPVVPVAAQATSGPLGILFVLNSISSLGIAYIFLILANIAVALAAFNVLPLPALDGGRLAVITWQKVTGRKLDPDLEAQIHGIGFLVLIGLMIVISIYDWRKIF